MEIWRPAVSRSERVEITEYGATRVVIEAALDRAALIVLSDTFYPGWQVSVNGVEAKALRVDGLLRGVFAGEGTNVIVWEYRPLSFRLGVIIFAASIVVSLFFFFFVRSRRRRDA